MRPRVAGIEFNGPFQEVDAGVVVLRNPGPDIGHGPNDAAPGIEAFRWLALQTKVVGSVELRFDRRDNAEP